MLAVVESFPRATVICIQDGARDLDVVRDRLRECLPEGVRRCHVDGLPFGSRLPRAVTQLGMPLIKPITKEIFRQDGFTVEAEQRAYLIHGGRPLPEPNPTVRRFNELAVRQWEEWLRVRERPVLDPELERAAARVKVL